METLKRIGVAIGSVLVALLGLVLTVVYTPRQCGSFVATPRPRSGLPLTPETQWLLDALDQDEAYLRANSWGPAPPSPEGLPVFAAMFDGHVIQIAAVRMVGGRAASLTIIGRGDPETLRLVWHDHGLDRMPGLSISEYGVGDERGLMGEVYTDRMCTLGCQKCLAQGEVCARAYLNDRGKCSVDCEPAGP